MGSGSGSCCCEDGLECTNVLTGNEVTASSSNYKTKAITVSVTGADAATPKTSVLVGGVAVCYIDSFDGTNGHAIRYQTYYGYNVEITFDVSLGLQSLFVEDTVKGTSILWERDIPPTGPHRMLVTEFGGYEPTSCPSFSMGHAQWVHARDYGYTPSITHSGSVSLGDGCDTLYANCSTCPESGNTVLCPSGNSVIGKHVYMPVTSSSNSTIATSFGAPGPDNLGNKTFLLAKNNVNRQAYWNNCEVDAELLIQATVKLGPLGFFLDSVGQASTYIHHSVLGTNSCENCSSSAVGGGSNPSSAHNDVGYQITDRENDGTYWFEGYTKTSSLESAAGCSLGPMITTITVS